MSIMNKLTCMKRQFYLVLCMLAVQQLHAQMPEDALRMGWTVPSGTAREQAIGGAMGSLGGDISTMFVNPAGLGLYKTGEFVLSPGMSFFNSKSSYRGTDAKADALNRFSLGASGLVLGFSNPNSKWSSSAFGLAVNRVANFNNVTYYKGQNNYSSFSEPLANEFYNYYVQQKQSSPNRSALSIVNQAIGDYNVSLQTRMALYTYLVDVDSANGRSTVVSRAEQAGTLNQENSVRQTGGITELALAFAGNMSDKWYIGGSLGFPILNYEKKSFFNETDAAGSHNNRFDYSRYSETYTSSGVGVNLKLGLIVKPVSQVRLGFALQTPSFYNLKDKVSASMTTNTDTLGNPPTTSVTSATINNAPDDYYKYNITSPWRFLASGSYVFHEVEDVTKQRGFITADVEYVTYGSPHFSSSDQNVSNDIYKNVNDAVKQIYKGAFNFRVGGELKFNTLMGRLGFAYYGQPYRDQQLKAHRMNLSGGLGYRNKGIFIDLTYVQALNQDVNFPYRVDPPRQNTYAMLKESSGTVLMTVGFKF